MASHRKTKRNAVAALERCLKEPPLRGTNLLPDWMVSTIKRSPPDAEVALYRHFDINGRLLYVGISLTVLARTRAHRASSWAKNIAFIAIEQYASREAAEAAERTAIETERPLYNIAGARPIPLALTTPEVTNGHTA